MPIHTYPYKVIFDGYSTKEWAYYSYVFFFEVSGYKRLLHTLQVGSLL